MYTLSDSFRVKNQSLVGSGDAIIGTFTAMNVSVTFMDHVILVTSGSTCSYLLATRYIKKMVTLLVP